MFAEVIPPEGVVPEGCVGVTGKLGEGGVTGVGDGNTPFLATLLEFGVGMALSAEPHPVNRNVKETTPVIKKYF